MAPKVSVILATHNRVATLPRAIESVLGQSYRDFELIVVDDGSTDRTREVLEPYASDGRVRIEYAPHRGCAAARNLGLELALGEYIAFQDSDDEWLPDRLGRTVAVLDASGPEVGVCFSAMTWYQRGGSVQLLKAPEVRRGRLVNDRTLDYQVWSIGIQASTIRRECFERVGRFDEALRRYIDLELFIRIAQQYEFARIEEPLVQWYQMSGITSNRTALFEARRYIAAKYRPLLRRRAAYLAYQDLQIALALLDCDRPRFRTRLGMVLGYTTRAMILAPFDERCRRKARAILERCVLGFEFWFSRGTRGESDAAVERKELAEAGNLRGESR